MGTSYDIRCIDCSEDAGVCANHDPVRAWELEPFLACAQQLATMVPYEDSLEIKTSEDTRISLKWLAKHSGHRLRLVSEYGEVQDTCRKRYWCEHCKSALGYCELDADHAEPCGKRPPGKR